MIGWMAFKAFCTKAWEFIKKYWQFFMGFLMAILGVLAFRGRSNGIEVLENEKEANQKEIDAIKRAEEILKNKTRDALYIYERTVREVEKKFEEDNQTLSEDMRNEVRRIIEDAKEDPSEITSRISKLTGYEIYVEED